MRPTKFTLYELFERKRRYVVPLYQRQYVWNQEDQLEPLWDDIRTKAAEIQQGQRPRPHFLGAIVLGRQEIFGKELEASTIIDGQQRLTTLQVLLAAFRDAVRNTPHAEVLAELERLTNNSGLKAREEERHKVWPTRSDQKAFSDVMTASSLAELEKLHPAVYQRRKLQPRHPLVEAYVFFHSVLRPLSECPSGDESTLGIDAVFMALQRQLHVVVIELEDDDDPQVIFETLNARGAPLLPSDLIRNFIFLQASRQDANADQLYEKWWRGYDERKATRPVHGETRFWRIEQRQGRLSRPRLDLFFSHFLASIQRKEPLPTHVFDDFQDWWRREPRNLETELQRVKLYADAFAMCLEPETSTRLGVFLRRLAVFDTMAMYPMLLELLVERQGELEGAKLQGALLDLESFLVRRSVCGLTAKNYNRFFPALQAKLAGSHDFAAELRKELLSGSGEVSRWPSNAEFERSWLNSPSYRVVGPARTQVILRALEEEVVSSRREKIEIQQDLTVEHVMPQEWREHWQPPEAGPTDPEGDSVDERRDRLLHSFGNLTLLTQPLNSSVSNGAYDGKRPEIAKQSALQLNTAFQEALSWNEATILARGRELLNLSTKIWAHPDEAMK